MSDMSFSEVLEPANECEELGHAWEAVGRAKYRCSTCGELFVDEDGAS
jgi:tRNA(Ile2) C34 agmatinyltransferase TiaS